MTTRTLVLDSPLLVGFEHTRALLERVAKAASEGWPPYNVEQLDGGGVRITLAVAGFSADQLSVMVEANQLQVIGRRDEEGAPRPEGTAYLHRGIASRGFQRSFVLADGMEVGEALLEHGLLHIAVTRPEPQRLQRRIPIRTA